MKKLCHICIKRHKDYHPIKYALGKCEECGRYLGVAECERYDMPEGFNEVFGDLTKQNK